MDCASMSQAKNPDGGAAVARAAESPLRNIWMRKHAELIYDAFAALGWAHVMYLGQWSHIMTLRATDYFWMVTPPEPLRYVSLSISTILMAVVAFMAIRTARMHGVFAVAGRIVLGVLALISLNVVREALAGYYPEEFGGNLLRTFSADQLYIGLFLLGIVGLVGLIYLKKYLISLLRVALVTISALAIFNLGGALFTAYGSNQAVQPPIRHAAFLPASPDAPPRVVWVVFDELDYRLAFIDREKDLALPNFDELRQKSVFASHAFPPSGATTTSMLTYISGENIVAVRPDNATDILVRSTEHPQVHPLTGLPTLFSEARKAGVNGALVGWYLPYSKFLGQDTVDCWWFDKLPGDAFVGRSLATMLIRQPRGLVETSLLSPFGQSLLTQRRIQNVNGFMGKAHELLRDPRIGLLLLHIPVPHTPYFYDRHTGRNTLANSTIAGYWDALALADKMLGNIEKELEAANNGNVALIVTSDHYYRTAMRLNGRMDRRVPFLCRMPGQKQALVFDKAFNTRLIHDFVLAIEHGGVRTDSDAVKWLNETYNKVPVGWPQQEAAVKTQQGGENAATGFSTNEND